MGAHQHGELLCPLGTRNGLYQVSPLGPMVGRCWLLLVAAALGWAHATASMVVVGRSRTLLVGVALSTRFQSADGPLARTRPRPCLGNRRGSTTPWRRRRLRCRRPSSVALKSRRSSTTTSTTKPSESDAAALRWRGEAGGGQTERRASQPAGGAGRAGSGVNIPDDLLSQAPDFGGVRGKGLLPGAPHRPTFGPGLDEEHLAAEFLHTLDGQVDDGRFTHA